MPLLYNTEPTFVAGRTCEDFIYIYCFRRLLALILKSFRLIRAKLGQKSPNQRLKYFGYEEGKMKRRFGKPRRIIRLTLLT